MDTNNVLPTRLLAIAEPVSMQHVYVLWLQKTIYEPIENSMYAEEIPGYYLGLIQI